ncbi:GH92 family glycosyl hydrolase [Leptolyngbya sp. 7M]|uniref:GH92 family glycosyl hydrolase n=1 Tax=Leptolyngbya sp. 7M TaxID=2812896 RepID=UPI001B8BA665|nr:GH92 family glycosyl hydrolase [Leptolyngbya sp. 7M]QYO66482.1 GH92 family glycosyl hydrolase [Leptolyngbya sp. 7M]
MRNYSCPHAVRSSDPYRTGRLLTLAVLTLLTAYCSLLTAQTRDYTRWVNPFIGTGGHGHTFPGATMPFGMVQLSPDTRIDNWDGSSGYHYSDDIIYGFSHTHLSGTGIPDGSDILFMPTTVEPKMPEGGRSITDGRYHQKFSHANERAEPGYYTVKLDDNILVELTGTERVGFHRYRFPTGSMQRVIIDLEWRDRALNYWLNSISRNGNLQVEGYRTSSSWAKNQRVYFVAEFSRPFGSIKLGRDRVDPNAETRYAVLGFDERSGEELLVKVAISYVSIEGARKNLETELPHWDFDKVRADAKAAWNKELSKIEVTGGTEDQRTVFYTALYHTMIHPNVFNDVDGRYLGHDRKIHQLPGYTLQKPARQQGRNAQRSSKALADARASASDHYTVFSLWDTFRAAHPLYTIIDQRRTVDYINSFIRIYEQGGRLPVWELWGEETDTMIGYHSVSVIADAMAKGIKGFDYEKAYAAAKHSANLDHHGLAAYKRRGYISGEDDNESVSKTLEYAYNDWCISLMAELLQGLAVERMKISPDAQTQRAIDQYRADAGNFRRRSRYFENLFDRETGFMRPKRNGGFIEPFAPNEVTFHFTEGNSWQYSFFVPHNVPRLIDLMGGSEKFAAKLDELFTTEQKLTGRFQPDITGLIGQYAHGNEPSHHIPYLYNYVDQRGKAQKYVRKVMDEFYKNAPDGLIGNEDCGQMSAWYVLSASGFYQVAPGTLYYEFGTPLFPEIKYHLENGRTFTIRAAGLSEKNIYVRSRSLNGKRHPLATLSHADIMNGGVLEFEMAEKADDIDGFRCCKIVTNDVAVPVINGPRTFREKASISIKTIWPGMKVFYTTDGTVPSERSKQYLAPFEVTETAEVKAIAVDEKGNRSLPVEARFQKRTNDWTVKLNSEYNHQYPGNGEDTIIDGLRGNANFAAGEWQGFWGRPFEAVIDLKRPTRINRVGGSFLQTVR